MQPKHDRRNPEAAQLITGHYDELPGYATSRVRGTEDWLLIATLRGGGRFGFPDGEHVSEPGELVLFRPNTPHDYGVAAGQERWELLWTHFLPRPEWMVWLRWTELSPGVGHLVLADTTLRARVFSRFAEVHDLATSALRYRETFAINALEEVLLWCDTENPLSEQARMDKRITDAMEYLVRHLAEPVSLDELATVCGLSVSRLAHLFRLQVGVTAQQYLESQRLHRAQQLLELTPRPISVIAAEVGYENPFYFTLRFKRATGLSPRDYRHKHAPR